jgi:hypothetical protein
MVQDHNFSESVNCKAETGNNRFEIESDTVFDEGAQSYATFIFPMEYIADIVQSFIASRIRLSYAEQADILKSQILSSRSVIYGTHFNRSTGASIGGALLGGGFYWKV